MTRREETESEIGMKISSRIGDEKVTSTWVAGQVGTADLVPGHVG